MHGHKLLLAKPHLALGSTGDTFHQLEITRKCDRITLINICVFKSPNIAVLGVFWHHPDRNPE